MNTVSYWNLYYWNLTSEKTWEWNPSYLQSKTLHHSGGSVVLLHKKWNLMHLVQWWEQSFNFSLNISSKVSELILTLIQLAWKDIPSHCLSCELFLSETSRGHFPVQFYSWAGTDFSPLKPIVFHEVDTINVWMEKEMATRSSILAWRILWTKEPGYSP